MLSGWRTIWYFLWRGGAYGAVFGAIAGTFIIPFYLSMIGMAWGAVVGLVMGTLLGIGVHFYNRRAYRQQMEFEEYQTNLVTGAELATVIITALPLAVLLAPMAGLAAAYVTHRYTEDHAHHIIKRKNEGLLPDTQSHMEKKGTVDKFFTFFSPRTKWVYLVGVGVILLGGIIVEIAAPNNSSLGLIFSFTVGWSFYVALVNLFVGFTNGIFIQMLNRVVFSPEWTPEQYKRWVMVSAGLFTLVITPVVGLFIGAPILAVLAMLAARDYADWYFEGETIDKAKRDASRLAETFDTAERDDLSGDTLAEEMEKSHAR